MVRRADGGERAGLNTCRSRERRARPSAANTEWLVTSSPAASELQAGTMLRIIP